MAFYDDGKPVGGYGMRSNSDYTIEDIASDLGGGGGSEMGCLAINPTSIDGTYTLNGNTVQFTEVSYGKSTMREANVPAGSIVTFTPSKAVDTAGAIYCTREQIENNSSPEFTIYIDPTSSHISIPIVSNLITIFGASRSLS